MCILERKNNTGFYYEDEFVATFRVILVAQEECTMLSSISKDEKRFNRFVIKAELANGSFTKEKELNSVNTIKSYNDLWPECIDADLTSKQLRLIRLDIQLQLGKNIVKRALIKNSGLYTFTDNKVAIIGNKMVWFKAQNRDNTGFDLVELYDNDVRLNVYEQAKTCEINNWVDRMVRLQPDITPVMFYWSMLGILKPFIVKAGIPVNFILNIYGKSGSMKSSIAQCYSPSIMNYHGKEVQVAGFHSRNSKKDIVKMVASNTMGNVRIDDMHYCCQKYQRDQQEAILDAIISEVDINNDSANVVITSEELVGIWSRQDRELQLHMKSIENLEEFAVLQKNTWVIPTIQHVFLTNIMKNYDQVISTIKEVNDEFYFNLAHKGSINFRAERYASIILLTEKVFSIVMNCTSFSDLLGNVVNKVITEQYEHMNSIDKVERIMDYVPEIYNMLEGNYILICTQSNNYSPYEYEAYAEHNKLYITYNALKYGMKKYLKVREDQISMKKIIADLENSQVLEQDIGDARTKKKFGIRHYVINRQLMIQYIKLLRLSNG